jgi:redox-sensitive bicupin YhaK (pirin superfamily)
LKAAAAAPGAAARGAGATGAKGAPTPGPVLPAGTAADGPSGNRETVRPARIAVRPADARGHANYGWLDTNYTFSFASYYDPRHMGFRSLRVINEDWIDARQGFPMHPHRDMEIVTYVLEGSLEHKDSLGNGGVIVPTEVQRMSAGTGIYHSEYSAEREGKTHLLQIWIEPDANGVRPGYGQKVFPMEGRRNGFRLVASPDGRDGSIAIHAGTNLYASILESGKPVSYENAAGRHVWIQVARGSLDLNGTALRAGDGASTSDAGLLRLSAKEPSELLLFDLA